MRAHRRTRCDWITCQQRLEDALVVGMRGQAQFRRVKVVFNLGPDRPLGLRPHCSHHLQQHAVASRFGDAQMKQLIGGLIGLLVVDMLTHVRQRREDAVEVTVLARLGCN